jgi:L-cysteate sulfo-lyase
LERVGIGFYPTPFDRMPRLEAHLNGPRLFVKRDDLTGVALGGNKIRQLDYMLVKAKKQRCDYLITTCGIQSNWSRQVVAMAARMGMKASLVLRTAQYRSRPRVFEGNILLDHIMGAEIKIIKMRIHEDPAEILESEAERLRRKGHNPFVLGFTHGELPLGIAAYVDAAIELIQQTTDANLDAIVLATGGGATQAGLILSMKIMGLKTKVIGVNVGAFKTNTIMDTILNSSNETAKLLGTNVRLTRNDVIIRDECAGSGYGIPTKESIRTLRSVAQSEALILDPVYTAKAMAGLTDMIKAGEFEKDQRVCFLHTGGIPALFAYKQYFQPHSRAQFSLDKRNFSPTVERLKRGH